mmetsp:Transcript_5376/g.13281  ORF Transcript_5376/g.13281 Transcript_5376/m.13281 type:complete len:191 (+) Transcript_5376:675-1247(+)
MEATHNITEQALSQRAARPVRINTAVQHREDAGQRPAPAAAPTHCQSALLNCWRRRHEQRLKDRLAPLSTWILPSSHGRVLPHTTQSSLYLCTAHPTWWDPTIGVCTVQLRQPVLSQMSARLLRERAGSAPTTLRPPAAPAPTLATTPTSSSEDDAGAGGAAVAAGACFTGTASPSACRAILRAALNVRR